MTPLHPNSQTSSCPWEWAFSRPGTCRRGPWSQLTYPTIWLFCWANPENFSLFHSVDQKLFHFYRQTHRQMHILHPYMHSKIFFCMEIYTFHFTMFLCLLCLLTSFVKDNFEPTMANLEWIGHIFIWKFFDFCVNVGITIWSHCNLLAGLNRYLVNIIDQIFSFLCRRHRDQNGPSKDVAPYKPKHIQRVGSIPRLSAPSCHLLAK